MSLDIECKRCKKKLDDPCGSLIRDTWFLSIYSNCHDYAHCYVCTDCLTEFEKMYNDWLKGEVKE